MQIEDFRIAIIDIENALKSKGLRGSVRGHVHWFGDEVAITVEANETPNDKGYWKSTREFNGLAATAEKVAAEAKDWVYALPNSEDRAIELMVQKLNKIASELPEGGSDIARAAWAEIHGMLMAKAESIAKNGLPSPARIQQLRDSA